MCFVVRPFNKDQGPVFESRSLLLGDSLRHQRSRVRIRSSAIEQSWQNYWPKWKYFDEWPIFNLWSSNCYLICSNVGYFNFQPNSYPLWTLQATGKGRFIRAFVAVLYCAAYSNKAQNDLEGKTYLPYNLTKMKWSKLFTCVPRWYVAETFMTGINDASIFLSFKQFWGDDLSDHLNQG